MKNGGFTIVITSACLIAFGSSNVLAGEQVSIGVKFDLTNIVLVDNKNRTVGSLGFSMKIVEVVPGSPAEIAGLKTGDFITSIDGVQLKNLKDELELFVLLDKTAGSELHIEALREIKKFDPNTPGIIDPKEYYESRSFRVVVSKPFAW